MTKVCIRTSVLLVPCPHVCRVFPCLYLDPRLATTIDSIYTATITILGCTIKLLKSVDDKKQFIKRYFQYPSSKGDSGSKTTSKNTQVYVRECQQVCGWRPTDLDKLLDADVFSATKIVVGLFTDVQA